MFSALSFPVVFWAVKIADFHDDPSALVGTSQNVRLPNGVVVLVGSIRFQGTSGAFYRWQGDFIQAVYGTV